MDLGWSHRGARRSGLGRPGDPAGDNWQSAITVGAAPLGSIPKDFGYDVAVEQAVQTVLATIDSEINAIDTSNGYGEGRSEQRIGEAFERRGGKPDDFLVITKVDKEGDRFDAERIRESVRESKERLGVDFLPLVHLHDPEIFDYDYVAGPGGAVEGLVQLKEEGEIGAIGLAGGPAPLMSRYLDLGVFDALLMHNRWTLVDRSAREIFAKARAGGPGIFNAAIYGGGILARMTPTSNDTYCYSPAPAELLAAITRMRGICADYGTDLGTAALQFSLRDPQVDTTIVGMSKPERVATTMAAARAELPEAIWAELEAELPEESLWIDHRR